MTTYLNFCRPGKERSYTAVALFRSVGESEAMGCVSFASGAAKWSPRKCTCRSRRCAL